VFKVKYFDLDKLLKRLFISIDKSLEGIKCTQPLDHIVLFHLCRSIRLTKGILNQSFAGYALEGKILLRSQFNLVVNLKWLTLTDTPNRVQRFMDFESINKKKGADNLIHFSDISEEKIKLIKRHPNYNIEHIKKKYRKDDLRNWSGKNICEMSEEVGLLDEYKVMYFLLSEIEHTGPNSIDKFLKGNQEIVQWMLKPRDKDIPLTIISSADFLFMVLEIFSENFGIELKKFLAINNKFDLIREKYFTTK